MSRGKFLSIIYSIVAILSVITVYRVYYLNASKFDNQFVVSYMPNTIGVCVYEPEEVNTMKCNMTTVNTIISNMIQESYFYIEKDFSKDNLLDVLLSNGDEQYRILYNRRTRDFMCMSKPFLKNYIPMTYIHE